jgi:5-methylthioribose kinase
MVRDFVHSALHGPHFPYEILYADTSGIIVVATVVEVVATEMITRAQIIESLKYSKIGCLINLRIANDYCVAAINDRFAMDTVNSS